MKSNLQLIIEETRTTHPGVRIVVAGMEAPPNMGVAYATEFRQAFADLARENDALLIPFLLEGVAGNPDLNQADGIHPTAQGHRVIAKNVWDVLGPLLEQLN
jgi:acyl-CoA thioesterase-1